MKTRITYGLVAFLLLISLEGLAQEIQSEIILYKVVYNEEKKEELIETGSVRPNDLVEYQLRYSNAGSEDIKNFKAVLPIPVGLKLVQINEAIPREPRVSLDSQSWYSYPILEESAEGNADAQPIKDEQYRFLQWQLPVLAAGAQQVFKARMQVL